MIHHSNFQKRAPKGHPAGGQWVDEEKITDSARRAAGLFPDHPEPSEFEWTENFVLTDTGEIKQGAKDHEDLWGGYERMAKKGYFGEGPKGAEEEEKTLIQGFIVRFKNSDRYGVVFMASNLDYSRWWYERNWEKVIDQLEVPGPFEIYKTEFTTHGHDYVKWSKR